MKNFLVCLILGLLLLSVMGCNSQPLRIANLSAGDYEELGTAEGKATGIMLFQLIPIGQNERFVKAYNKAVESKGGDGMIDMEVSERWFWGYILNGYVTTVKGTVVKKK